MVSTLNPLRLNVGFISAENIGYSRDFSIDLYDVLVEPDLQLSALNGTVNVTRTPQGLFLVGHFETAIPTECSKCLTPFLQHLTADFSELYAFSQRTVAENGLTLPRDGHIDLNPILREYLLLDHPINPICKPDCKGLCFSCGIDLNTETCTCDHTKIDPRLEKLRDFLNDE